MFLVKPIGIWRTLRFMMILWFNWIISNSRASLHKHKPTIIIFIFLYIDNQKGIGPLIDFSDSSYTKKLELLLLPYFHGSVYHLLKSKELQKQFKVGMFCQGMYWVIYCVTFSHQDKKPLLEDLMQLVASTQEERNIL